MGDVGCYICGSNNHIKRPGSVRDNASLEILECVECGLVFLSNFDHIHDMHYSESGMHGGEKPNIDNWLKECEKDDERRYRSLQARLTNKKILDFGCGAGGFIEKVKATAASVNGVEPEQVLQSSFKNRDLSVWKSLREASDSGECWDVITAFHVVEHLPDPRKILIELSKLLTQNGELVIEVPSADDALLTLYESKPFQKFTYWSQHLFLFNAETLHRLAIQAGLRLVSIQHIQRYPLSNHLYWLSKGKPGGHQNWSFLDTPDLNEVYAASLAALGKSDTLIAYLVPEKH